MVQSRIEQHGVIGDMHTAALVDVHGTIDWLCLPRFDSPSVFAALLSDQAEAGSFQIRASSKGASVKQFYWPDSNVLVTRFLCSDGVGEVRDYMTPGTEHRRIVRTVQATSGEISFFVHCLPAFDYGRGRHELSLSANGAIFTTAELQLSLSSPVPLQRRGGGVECEFALREGESATFVLQESPGESECPPPLEDGEAEVIFRRTIEYWRDWLSSCTYEGRWREEVRRSALALKLLTYEPTGAVVAAPTTSLPERLGGVRNWDYRYSWVRDAALTVHAFLRIGFKDEARGFMEFLATVCRQHSVGEGPLQVMYGIDGRKELPEETLGHLPGYLGSGPVRVGNLAHRQLQLDIYGELLESVLVCDEHVARVSYDWWRSIRAFADWVCEQWRCDDASIWESRAGHNQFVHSKLMCWVALDRALRLARRRSLPAPRERWLAERDEIFEEIMSRGWNSRRGSFVQTLDGEHLDAALLTMPTAGFIAATDARMESTLDAILQPLQRGGLTRNSLVYRYDPEAAPDGFDGTEGTFNICTFWLVEALTMAGRGDKRRLEQARLTFEEMLGYANHVGLFAEQTGNRGEALGNFPQAFTHLGLIEAACRLDQALDGAGSNG